MWSGFGQGPVRFGVRSRRQGIPFADVRDELQAALGIELVPHHREQKCKAEFPTCEVRLLTWPAEVEHLHVFNFIGSPRPLVDGFPPKSVAISDDIAAFLRASGGDWYVPSYLEYQEEGGTLHEELLDRDVLLSILDPQWLSSLNEDERRAGRAELERIVNGWLAASRRAPDPLKSVVKRKRQLQREYAEPAARLRILTSHTLKA